MKASEILANAATARKCLTHLQWYLLLTLCACPEKGMSIHEIERARWTGRSDGIKRSLQLLCAAKLITRTRKVCRGGDYRRGPMRWRATPKAFKLLNLEPETTITP